MYSDYEAKYRNVDVKYRDQLLQCRLANQSASISALQCLVAELAIWSEKLYIMLHLSMELKLLSKSTIYKHYVCIGS